MPACAECYKRLRETDVVARLGGDEFAVLLAREDSATAETVAEALLEVIHDKAAATDSKHRHMTPSIGIACFSDRELLTADEIMVNADLAMYDAKEDGRNFRAAGAADPAAERRRPDPVRAAPADARRSR